MPDDYSKTDFISHLKKTATWVRRETIRIHSAAPGTRLASSLSDIEIFVALYYGKILNFDPKNPFNPDRDRFIISKGHGSISLYPILADLGFFEKAELGKVCTDGSFLGAIPDPIIPGYETVNGSLGHGPGVAAGMAYALRLKKSSSHVFIIAGDGELYEGAAWEALMFAGHHKLNNITLIIDHNKASMLGFCKDIIDLNPFDEKLKAFNWEVKIIDGHNMEEVYDTLIKSKNDHSMFPRAIIANTIKGRGVERLENDPLSHIRSLTPDEANLLINKLDKELESE